jgi:hypothetical protein
MTKKVGFKNSSSAFTLWANPTLGKTGFPDKIYNGQKKMFWPFPPYWKIYH